MRITNSNREQNINLTKCTKMTEEEYRVYGMNGVTNSGKVASKEDSSQNTDNYSQGGRLKFFKSRKKMLCSTCPSLFTHDHFVCYRW